MTPPAGIVGARPGRLTRFRTIGAEVADALRVRSVTLDGATFSHQANTEPSYQVDLGDLVTAVEVYASSIRDLGSWVGDVGDAFFAAGVDDPDGRRPLPERTFGSFYAGLDTVIAPGRALLGPVPATRGEPASTGDDGDGGSPLDRLGELTDPAALIEGLLDTARVGGGLAAEAGRGAAVAALLASPRFATYVTWFGAVGSGLGVVTGAAARWEADADLDLPLPDRVGRAAAQAGAETAGAVLGAATGRGIGMAIGGLGGPIGAAAGGILGGLAAGKAADAFLDEDPSPPEPGELGDAVGAVDHELVDEALDTVDAATAGTLADPAAAADAAWVDPGDVGARYDEAVHLGLTTPTDAVRPSPPSPFRSPFDPAMAPSPGGT